MPRFAVLDEENNHVGYRVGDSPGIGEVEVPDECDLEPGRYFYSPEIAAFMPRLNTTGSLDQIPPNPLRMILKALRAVEASGVIFGSDVVKWMDDYERTMDGAGISVVKGR